jgi:hypothetical protein
VLSCWATKLCKKFWNEFTCVSLMIYFNIINISQCTSCLGCYIIKVHIDTDKICIILALPNARQDYVLWKAELSFRSHFLHLVSSYHTMGSSSHLKQTKTRCMKWSCTSIQYNVVPCRHLKQIIEIYLHLQLFSPT